MDIETNIINGLCSHETLLKITASAKTPYMLLSVDARRRIEITPQQFERFTSVMDDTGAAIVYSDYISVESDGSGKEICRSIDYRPGSVRDDFDFGPAVLVNTELFARAVAKAPNIYRNAAWYDVRLRLGRMAPIVHVPETLYTAYLPYGSENGDGHFDYVDPRNSHVQKEMEAAFTDHLKAVGAYLPPATEEADAEGDFEAEASVIIPVRNRVATIADAISSALQQKTDFPYNVIVVDNHSTDGTTEVIDRFADDQRLIHLIPESTDHGIGGCWNEALQHERCGRYAVQLDSDDRYSGDDTLSRIVDCFRKERCAMVVGAYSLTDFHFNAIPPGIIDHKEWTDENGHNNLLRVNGIGAPRAFVTTIARQMAMPDVSYGEDYAMALRISRRYRIGRIFDVLYQCRRWNGNSDSGLSREKANQYNTYKDTLRTWELEARIRLNKEK